VERDELQEFVRGHRKDTSSLLELMLWNVAELAPLGGTVVSPTEDPYLLRVYVSPRSPQFKLLWAAAKRQGLDLGEFREDLAGQVPRFFLHHFFRGDADEAVHNHPWSWSASLILTGGYREDRWDPEQKALGTRYFFPGDVNVIRRDDFHRVTLLTPERGCWTLFLATGRVEEKSDHDWGFLDPETEQYTPWGPWVARRRAQPTVG